MDMLDVILAKRYGQELNRDQISFFVKSVTDRSVPDYQISAFLMAIVLNGMSEEEMTELTMEMAFSGAICDLGSIPGTKVDKHSSGGVGDKCTLVVLPIVCALGVPVAKLSGRGLGFTGGTIDKLESVVGFNTSIPVSDFSRQIEKVGMVLSGQTPELAPADKYLYALRDVTGTVESIPLIASSIMSKKIAGGADAIVLDVTCGKGAFMKNQEVAGELARAMIQIGKIAKRPVTCVITAMDQPLGYSVGNSLEVMEAYETLSGHGPADVVEVSCTLAAAMLKLSDVGRTQTFEKCYDMALASLSDGRAKAAFEGFIKGQGGSLHSDGSPMYVSEVEERGTVTSSASGYISHLDALLIGEASMGLGAGRRKKEDSLDMGAGIRLHKKIGDLVEAGEVIATLYQGSLSPNDPAVIKSVTALVESAVTYSKHPVPEVVDILAILDEESI